MVATRPAEPSARGAERHAGRGGGGAGEPGGLGRGEGRPARGTSKSPYSERVRKEIRDALRLVEPAEVVVALDPEDVHVVCWQQAIVPAGAVAVPVSFEVLAEAAGVLPLGTAL